MFDRQLEEEGLDSAVHDSRRKLPPFRGDLLDYHLKCFGDKESRTDAVNENDARWIQDSFEKVNRLASESEQFRLSLESAIDWRFAKEPRSAVARLWLGIEALFGIRSEQVYRISLYSASLLSERGTGRKEMFTRVKKLYGSRSKIVHGDKLSDELIGNAMNDSFHLLRDLLILLISNGRPFKQADLDEAVLG